MEWGAGSPVISSEMARLPSQSLLSSSVSRGLIWSSVHPIISLKIYSSLLEARLPMFSTRNYRESSWRKCARPRICRLPVFAYSLYLPMNLVKGAMNCESAYFWADSAKPGGCRHFGPAPENENSYWH